MLGLIYINFKLLSNSDPGVTFSHINSFKSKSNFAFVAGNNLRAYLLDFATLANLQPRHRLLDNVIRVFEFIGTPKLN